MISLPMQNILFIYVLVFLAAVFLLWVAYEVSRQRELRSSQRRRIRCLLCAMEYMPEETDPEALSPCPSCGYQNEPKNQANYF